MALVASLALAGCLAGTGNALEAARQACSDMGFENGKSKGSDGSSVGDQSAEAWAVTAADYDGIANRLAGAARQDARWDRLSNAITDFQAAAMEQMAITKDESLPQTERDAAQVEVDRFDV